jgi:hypothetical protein
MQWSDYILPDVELVQIKASTIIAINLSARLQVECGEGV